MSSIGARSLRVRILGAGVAGLAAARALSLRLGVTDIEIFERDTSHPVARRTGHGLLLMQNGVKALRALDAEGILNGYTILKRAIIRDGRGTALHVDTFDDVYCVTREALIDGLRAALPTDAISFERQCERVDVAVDGPRRHQTRVQAVRFRGGAPLLRAEFDLLVGADGVHSAVCGALNPDFDRPVSRVREIVTSTAMPALAAQLNDTFVKIVDPDKGIAFGLLAPTKERVIGFLQFDSERYPPLRRSASPAEFRQFLQFIMEGAPEPVPAYLEGADYATAHLWNPPDADMPHRLHCANAVLIGDAAHPLLPFTSQGVSAGLEDAVILADRLAPVVAGEATLPDALIGFSATRRRYTEPYIARGRHILNTFVDNARGFAAPYVDGTTSELEGHLWLTERDLAYIFQILDVDGDGYLNRREFDDALHLFEFELQQAEKDALFADFDTERDDRLQIAGMIAALGGTDVASPLLQKFQSARTPRRIQLLERHRRLLELFRLVDRSGSGQVEFRDFGVVAAAEGLILTMSELRKQFEAADLNGDGRLDFREMAQLFANCHGDPVLEHLLDVAAATKVGGEAGEPDPLFAAESVDETTLRARAFNHRWADQPAGVIPLTAADPDFPVADDILDAMRNYLKAGYLSYGPAEGLPDLRASSARWFRERRAIDCRAEQVFVTNSAASGLYLVAQRVLRGGDEALVADPCDFLFERSVRAACGKVVRYGLHKQSNHRIDIGAIEGLITPRTKLLTICNPHNPLGFVWERAELELLVDLAIRYNLQIMSDEVWSDIVFEPAKFVSIASLSPEAARRTFTIYGFSKGYGLAGLRLGLVIAPDATELGALVSGSHADETAYGVSTLSQVAGIAALERGGEWLGRFVAHLKRQRDHTVARLNRIDGVSCHVPDATFVIFPDVSSLGIGVEEIAATLKDRFGVAVVPGSEAFFGPGAAGHLRLSLATSRRILDEGLDRLTTGIGAIRAARAQLHSP